MKPREIIPDVAIGINRLLEIVGKYFNLLIILFVTNCNELHEVYIFQMLFFFLHVSYLLWYSSLKLF